MGKIVSYELQTYRMGTWKIDSIFDDKELALFEARRVAESRRHSAVRVVQEDYDENTNDTTNRIVYRSSSVAESNNQAAEKQRQMKRPAAARPTGGGEIMGKRRAAAPQKDNTFSFGIILTAGSILLLGIAAMLALHYVANSL
ncbi:MAG: hypothetical protein RLP16_02260 [Alphaproteobacteria bacterium]